MTAHATARRGRAFRRSHARPEREAAPREGALPAPSMVGMPGFEPGTSASRTLRANQAALHPEGDAMLAVDRFDLTSEELLDGAAEGPRVDRLDQLRVGVDALGEEAVGLPIEEQ